MSHITVSRNVILGATIVLCLALCMSAVALVRSGGGHTPKIGFVRSGELLNGYHGMKEARELYEGKQSKWRADLDTLQLDYQKALNTYNTEYERLSSEDRRKREEMLGLQEEKLKEYSYAVAGKAREEDEKVTQGVLNQINSVAKEYGEENEFDLIVATTQSGNILYGDQGIDITRELLIRLNQHYRGHAISNESSSEH